MEVGAIEHVDELPNPWSEFSVPKELDEVDDGLDGWGFDGNYDDSPLTLTDEQVQVGKLRELSQMESLKIYKTATREEASDCKHITTRWEVQMRHDKDKRPVARCRFVAREFRRGDPRDDIFAPASSAITSRIVALKAQKRRGYIRFTLDASNAFFHAPCLEKCSVDPPRRVARAVDGEGWRPRRCLDLGTRALRQACCAMPVDHLVCAAASQPWLAAVPGGTLDLSAWLERFDFGGAHGRRTRLRQPRGC
jgi:hypothetical protein